MRHVNEDTHMSEFAFGLQFLEPGDDADGSYRIRLLVENAAVEWNEVESPFHVVARLRLLPKSVLPPAESETFYIDVTEHSTPSRGRSAASIVRAGTPSRKAGPRVWRNLSRRRRGRQRSVVKIRQTALGVAALVFVAAVGWAIWPVTRDLPERLQYPATPLGSNGLTAEAPASYYHLSEGGEAYRSRGCSRSSRR